MGKPKLVDGITNEISRLFGAGFKLLPLGGGQDGKKPLRKFSGDLSLAQILGPMYGANSSCYGVRLDGLAVIDCDVSDQSLIDDLQERFGSSPVQVSTPRGVHLYYRSNGIKFPDLRSEGLQVDIKRGLNSYVVGPQSIRPNGGEYIPLKGTLGVTTLSLMRLKTDLHTVSADRAIPKGSRNRRICKYAIEMVESVDNEDELFGNLLFIRDNECEESSTIPDTELRKIANWAWTKRLDGKVYHSQNSDFPINRQSIERLRGASNYSDTVALFVTLQSQHGHIKGKTFALNHERMLTCKLTDLSRRRFKAAIETMLSVGLLAIAKEYSTGRFARTYRLTQIKTDHPNIHELHENTR